MSMNMDATTRTAPTAATAKSAQTTIALHAGFWRRVGAYFIDSVVIMVGAFVVLFALSFAGERVMRAAGLLVLLLMAGYFIIMHSSPVQATVGKMLMGVKVTDGNGHRIGAGRATGRFFGLFLSSITLGIGYALAGVTARRQALHDMVAGTLVVRADARPEEVVAGGGPMPITARVNVAVIGLPIASFLFGMLTQ